MNKKIITAFERSVIPVDDLTKAELTALLRTAKRLKSGGNAQDDFVLRVVNNRLETGKFTGVVDCGGSLRIEILPKTAKNGDYEKARQAALMMLQRVCKLDVRTGGISGVKENKDIYELLICLYLREVDRVIKSGLKGGYNTVENNLPFYKGRLLLNEHIRRNSAHMERFYVAYDEFSENCPENRLIKATLARLLSVSVSNDNRKKLRRRLELMDTIDMPQSITRDFAAVSVSRANPGYRKLMNWSRMFLHGNRLDPSSDKGAFNVLLFSAEELFEKFIGAELRKALPDWNVNLQESQKHLSGDPKLFRLRPDIVIRKGSKTVVLDTKWKLLSDDPENHYNISEKDVYQIFAYARAYDITDVFLIYPKPSSGIADAKMCFSLPDSVKVHIITVDLFDYDIASLKSALCSQSRWFN